MKKNLQVLILVAGAAILGLLALAVLRAGMEGTQPVQKPATAPSQASDREEDTFRERVKRPTNVILLSIDTLRRDHLPFYGYERVTAPHLQRLAEQAVVFDNAVSAHTNTAPSHATMLTGLYASGHGILKNGGSLREDVLTLPEVLRERGYRSGAFVSAYTLGKHTKLQRGFDPYNIELPRRRRRPAGKTYAEARSWIRERARAGQPFFLFLHFFDPHNPYDPPGEFAKMFRDDPERFAGVFPSRDRRRFRKTGTPELFRDLIARYDGEIAYADSQVGRLLEQLEQLGIAGHTLLAFVSDHGETLLEREWVFDHGCRVYDEQLLVPMVIRFPDRSHAGKRIDTQVSLVDLMPTILDLLEIPPPRTVAGRSLLPLLDDPGSAGDARPAFSNARFSKRRLGHIKARLTGRSALISSVRLPGIKLIEYPSRKGDYYQELFDLQADPGETRNLSREMPDLAARLHSQLEAWKKQSRSADAAEPPVLSPEVEAALRELGYIQ